MAALQFENGVQLMDIVYVYKASTTQELEYSIKSLKNIEYNRLLVIGDKPNFETPYLKPPINRWSMLSAQHDVINKLNFACTLSLTDDFILNNDDIFIMSPTHIPTLHRGLLKDHLANRRLNDSYTKTLKTTLHHLKALGINEPLSYELHTPMVFNKDKLTELLEKIIPLRNKTTYWLSDDVGESTFPTKQIFKVDP